MRRADQRSKPCYVSLAYSHAPSDSRIRRHCEALVRHGWRVYQIGLAAEGETRVGRLNGVVLLRWQRPRYRGARVGRYVVAYLGFLCWARSMLRRLGRKRAIRVVHVNNLPNFMVWAATRARRRGAGVILDIHDPVPEFFMSKFPNRVTTPLVGRLLRWEERLAARGADVVLCVHEPHRALTERHGVDARKLRVVENLADDRLFPIGSPRAAHPVVTYHGTVAARMGLDALLRAIRLLKDSGSDVHGAIWGDGDAVESLRVARDALGLTADVQIPGQRFRPEELVSRLGDSGIGVVPLRRDVFTDIMLPVKVLEYVRLGIPVVATWTPTLAFYFPDDSLTYIRDATPAGIAAALTAVLARPEEARARGARAQALPIAQAWQQRERYFVDLVQELASCP